MCIIQSLSSYLYILSSIVQVNEYKYERHVKYSRYEISSAHKMQRLSTKFGIVICRRGNGIFVEMEYSWQKVLWNYTREYLCSTLGTSNANSHVEFETRGDHVFPFLTAALLTCPPPQVSLSQGRIYWIVHYSEYSDLHEATQRIFLLAVYRVFFIFVIRKISLCAWKK